MTKPIYCGLTGFACCIMENSDKKPLMSSCDLVIITSFLQLPGIDGVDKSNSYTMYIARSKVMKSNLHAIHSFVGKH